MDQTPQVLPGLYPNLSNDEYHQGPGISCSGLKKLVKCPALFNWEYNLGNRKPQTPAMLKGSVFHCLTLEPQNFDLSYAVAPEGINKRTNAGKAELAEFAAANADKTIIDKPLFDECQRMADSVMADDNARYFLSQGGLVEASIFHTDEITGELVKVRPDKVNEEFIIDLKSTQDAEISSFSRSVKNFGYHLQLGMYQTICGHCVELNAFAQEFIFICVDQTEPYLTAVYQGYPLFEQGYIEYRLALDSYHYYKTHNYWPGYNNGQIVPIHLPAWATKQQQGAIYD